AEEFLTKSHVEGIQKMEELLRTVDGGLVFTNLVETDSLWGHRNDPVNFHRCLQDFDRRLPDLLEALRPGDLLILTSDHGCDPTTPSTDHSREHALLLAYVQGKNAAGRIHEGEFADVGATVNAWLGGKSPPRGIPGQPIVEETGAELVALDQSERMVELSRARGVDARVGDVQALPFPDGTFDCAVAAWMLYHVPDLDRGLAELARVLRPGGRLVAVTNSDRSLPELWGPFGERAVRIHGFAAEDGEELLGR